MRYSSLCLFLLLTSFTACSGKQSGDVIDRTMNLSREDYKSQLLPQNPAPLEINNAAKDGPPIPEIAPMVVSPMPPLIAKDKLVTLSVTEDVPLRDVLLELGRLAGMDIKLDQSISGGIILKVKDKPLSEVIEQIAEQAHLRYKTEGGILKIERDYPYIVNYQLDFLNLSRSTQSSISVNTNLGGQNSGGGNSSNNSSSGNSGNSGGTSSGIGSGSSNTITSTTDGNVWASIENDLKNILGVSSSITPSQATSSTAMPSQVDLTHNQNFLSINKQAGLVVVKGTSRQHQEIEKYLQRIKETMSAQVLIEAKVLEVTLNDEFRTGINWDVIDRKLRIGFRGNFTENLVGATEKVTIGLFDKIGKDAGISVSESENLQAVADLVQIFGTSRTLSSPRLHAMNNQQAVLSFAENKVYFTLDIETEDAQLSGGVVTQPSRTTVNSTINTVPIGMILTLQPSINLDSNEITMNIRPTLSRITGYVNDPAVSYLAATSQITDIKSEIPVVEVRELDSVLKIKNGQVMVIGGLMEERAANKDTGLPFFSQVPVAGNMFKSVTKTTQVVQTVIFIKASIVPGNSVNEHDKQFYRTFTRDPNPLVF